MLGKLKSIAKRIGAINQNKLVKEIFSAEILQSQIIDLNQKQLYEKGIQADGQPTGEYAYNTIYGTSRYEGKIAKGQPYDHITLKDTSAFYNSMDVVAQSDNVIMKVKDPNDLQAIYPEALGLTSESLQELRTEIKERFCDVFKNKLHTGPL